MVKNQLLRQIQKYTLHFKSLHIDRPDNTYSSLSLIKNNQEKCSLQQFIHCIKVGLIIFIIESHMNNLEKCFLHNSCSFCVSLLVVVFRQISTFLDFLWPLGAFYQNTIVKSIDGRAEGRRQLKTPKNNHNYF